MSARYIVRPKADHDLDEQAYYLAGEASPEAVTDSWWRRMRRFLFSQRNLG